MLLISRALLVHVAKLLPATSKLARQKAKICRTFDSIMRSCPERVSGRHMLVKSMLAICMGRREDGRPGYDLATHRLAKYCMNRQGAMWAQLTMAQQLAFEQRARQRANERRGELSAEWTELQAELDKIEGEQSKSLDKGSALTMSSAALDDEDLETFSRLFQQPGRREPATLRTQRAMIGLAPLPQGLSNLPAVWQLEDPDMPEWSKPLIRHRTLFTGSALVIQREDGSAEFWKIGFIRQSPILHVCVQAASCHITFSLHCILAAPRPPVQLSLQFRRLRKCSRGPDRRQR